MFDDRGKMRLMLKACTIGVLLFCGACAVREESPLGNGRFALLDPEHTNITFNNTLEYTETVNTYTFKNFYNGGGVGLADFNNDSLLDIFFTGNLVSNKLYLNKGSLEFEDITEEAGLGSQGSWSTGVSIADLNSDGYLDIYVCKSGPPGGDNRRNELFINNGNLTFTEKAAEFGLDFIGLSTHAAFFDFDRDGDLDCYLLNNSIRSIGAYDLRKDQRLIPDPAGGNKLLRNDDGKFVDVSAAAGIYTSMIGFGLGVTLGDINMDGWPDIYVSNDFFEKDYLYVNNGDGTFRECLEEMIREISLGSMGADMADINNDGLPEIFVTEMLPESDDRLKTTTQFESWDKYSRNLEQGYYRQFSRNVLQLNNGDGTFSEIGRLAGVHATDWSWGALITDLDNDGLKDIFVANGIYKDLLDQDYVNFVSNRQMIQDILQQRGQVIRQLIDSIPVNRIPNFAFRNNGNLSFSDESSDWGFTADTHSNGSAYGDLDNDGDLDLVLNNVNMPAYVYENTTRGTTAGANYLSVALRGQGKNNFAIGSKVTVRAGGTSFYQELFPSRGFMSSVDHKLTFGLGSLAFIDSVVVEWPDDRITVLRDIKANRTLTVYQSDATVRPVVARSKSGKALFRPARVHGIGYKHEESDFVDFDRDRLLFHMISNEGPCLCSGDANGDGMLDFYVGGAKNKSGRLYVQRSPDRFAVFSQRVFDADSVSEDVSCVFLDADGDGRQDLYVGSGSNEFSTSSAALLDRLYMNRGSIGFEKSPQLLPSASRFESTSVVTSADFDADGDYDLFVGVRVIPGLYGIPCSGYLLRNDGKGNFENITASHARGLLDIGMITDGLWADVNRDGKADLVVVGEWMAPQLFLNHDGVLEKSDFTFDHANGWYQSVAAADFNNDGWVDLITGNHGLNSRFKAAREKPVRLFVNDFDQNGSVEHITTRYYGEKSLPLVLRQDLVMQLPSLKKKYLHFDRYKGQAITDMFSAASLENAVKLEAFDFETALWLNNGDGSFTRRALPVEAQFSPTYAIYADDVDSDGNMDVLLAGNFSRGKPEVGVYLSGYGVLLKGDGQGSFQALAPGKSGISLRGEVRAIVKIAETPETIAIATNNDSLQLLTY